MDTKIEAMKAMLKAIQEEVERKDQYIRQLKAQNREARVTLKQVAEQIRLLDFKPKRI
jgi:archaellum component FlaC